MQNWRILPTATSLLESFKRILYRYLAANKTANFAFYQRPLLLQSWSLVQWTLSICVFMEVTLNHQSTMTEHFPAASDQE